MQTIILGIDTSQYLCSVGLLKNNNIDVFLSKKKNQHASFILPMIDNILKKHQISINNLNAIAYSCGPGKFTSLRIGLGIIKGLAIPINLPLISVSTTLSLAQQAFRTIHKKKILVALSAKKEKIYWAQYKINKYKIWKIIYNESFINIENAISLIMKLRNKWTIVGCNKIQKILCSSKFDNINNSKITFSLAEDILLLAKQKFEKKETISVNKAELNYLNNKIT